MTTSSYTMDPNEKTEESGDNSASAKRSGSSVRSSRRRFGRRDPGRMPADVLAKLIIAVITALLLVGFLMSFLMPPSQGPTVKISKPHEEKLEYARKKRLEGKTLRRRADSTGAAARRNDLYRQAEEILWESKDAYLELIDAHGEKGYGYLQTEIEDVQTNIYHCQKNRTIDGFD